MLLTYTSAFQQGKILRPVGRRRACYWHLKGRGSAKHLTMRKTALSATNNRGYGFLRRWVTLYLLPQWLPTLGLQACMLSGAESYMNKTSRLGKSNRGGENWSSHLRPKEFRVNIPKNPELNHCSFYEAREQR